MGLNGTIWNTPAFTLRGGSVNPNLGTSSALTSGQLVVETLTTLESGQLGVPVAGEGQLTKSTSGTVRLQKPNTYRALTLIDEGSLIVEVDAGLPSTTSVRINTIGVLDLGNTVHELASLETLGSLKLGNVSTTGQTTRSQLTVRGAFESGSASQVSLGDSQLKIRGNWTTLGSVDAGGSQVEFSAGLGNLQTVTTSGDGQTTFHHVTVLGVGELQLASSLQLSGTLGKSGVGTLDLKGHRLFANRLMIDGGLIRGLAGSQINTAGVNYDLRSGAVEVELTGGSGLSKTTEGTVFLRSAVNSFGNALVSNGTLRIEGQGSLPVDASLQIGTQGNVTIGNAITSIRSVTNSGSLVLADASSLLSVAEAATVGPNAKVSINGGSIDLKGSFNNFGEINLRQGSLVFSPESGTQSFDLAQGILSGNGNLRKRGNGLLTIQGSSDFAGALFVEGGSLRANARIPNVSATVQLSGVLQGSASLDRLQVERGGVVSPGNSPGSLTVNQLELAQGSVLRMEVGGPIGGLGYDQIVVRDQAILQGTMEVTLLNDYRPKPGEIFDLVTYNSRSGEFTAILPKVGGVEMFLEQEFTNAYRLIGAQIAPPITPFCPTGPGTKEGGPSFNPEDDNSTQLFHFVSVVDAVSESSLTELEDDAGSQELSWYESPVDPASIDLLPNDQTEIDQSILDTIYSAGLSLDLMSVTSDLEPVKSKPSELPPEPILRTVPLKGSVLKISETTSLESKETPDGASGSTTNQEVNAAGEGVTWYIPTLLLLSGIAFSLLGGTLTARSLWKSYRTRQDRIQKRDWEFAHGQPLIPSSEREFITEAPQSLLAEFNARSPGQ